MTTVKTKCDGIFVLGHIQTTELLLYFICRSILWKADKIDECCCAKMLLKFMKIVINRFFLCWRNREWDPYSGAYRVSSCDFIFLSSKYNRIMRNKIGKSIFNSYVFGLPITDRHNNVSNNYVEYRHFL